MATTTATITISSTDLLSDELALSTTATLTQAGNSTGLTGAQGLSRKTVSGGHAQYTLFDGDDYTANKAHKLYLKNTSTNAAEYFEIEVNSNFPDLKFIFFPEDVSLNNLCAFADARYISAGLHLFMLLNTREFLPSN